MNKVPALAISSLLIFLVASQGWAAPQVATYEGLLQAIRETRAASQAHIETVVEQEKVREAWETGKLIQEHILFNKERAGYGEQVIIKLAKDLGTSDTELKYDLQFARTYSIRPPADELSWAHYRELLSLNDPKERNEVTKEAVEKDWNRDQLREEIHRRKTASSLSSPNDLVEDPLPEITPGLPNTYQTFKQDERLKIDLGFDIYLDLPEKDNVRFEEGDIVTLEKGRLQKADKVPQPTALSLGAEAVALGQSSLFTYKAQVTHVIDGDTFYALIDLGFSITLYQRLRLRRLDAPEIVSAEGKEAKAVLEKILFRNKGRILAKVSKTDDQYGRYLVDVFIPGHSRESGNPEMSHPSIDQELLDSGLFTARGQD